MAKPELLPASEEVDPHLRAACATIGEVIEFWGFKKDMGMVWAYLYLRGEPATAKQIREYLEISTGQTSTVLQGLARWGVVRRITQLGKQPDLFSAETDLWRMISRVWRERELSVIGRAKTALQEALAGVKDVRKDAPLHERKALRATEKRLTELVRLATDGERAVQTFLDLSQLDFQSVVKFPRLRT